MEKNNTAYLSDTPIIYIGYLLLGLFVIAILL